MIKQKDRRDIRIRLAKRDGKRCYLCGLSGNRFVVANKRKNFYTAHIEHVRAQSNGGSDSDSNLKLACRWCNIRKGDMDLIDYIDSRIAKISLELKVLDILNGEVSKHNRNKDSKDIC